MKIRDLLSNGRPCFSFEFFPPKTDEDAVALMDTAATLKTLNPAFVSVTWGAGGGTRRKTIDITTAIREQLGLNTMSHLTCVGASRDELGAVLDELANRGVENILALRGDPPKGETNFQPHPDGFRHASELAAFIASRWTFSVGVAGYPEGHIECPDKDKDLDHLKKKVDAGADFVITQLFFNNDDFFRFVERARKRGVSVPLIPGLMPVTNVGQLKRFTAMCGAKIPEALAARLEPIKDDAEAVIQAGIDHAAEQARGLLAGGAPGVHFYTLNRSRSTFQVMMSIKKS